MKKIKKKKLPWKAVINTFKDLTENMTQTGNLGEISVQKWKL